MRHYIYAPNVGRSGVVKQFTQEECKKFYLRHYRNVLLLERIKTLHEDFLTRAHVEEEIRIGTHKCEYFYKRCDIKGADIVKEIRDIKIAIGALDISHFA